MLGSAERAISEIDHVWRVEWSAMTTNERDHYLSIELMDVERYLRELVAPTAQPLLTDLQGERVRAAEAAWARSTPTRDAMSRSLVGESKRSGVA